METTNPDRPSRPAGRPPVWAIVAGVAAVGLVGLGAAAWAGSTPPLPEKVAAPKPETPVAEVPAAQNAREPWEAGGKAIRFPGNTDKERRKARQAIWASLPAKALSPEAVAFLDENRSALTQLHEGAQRPGLQLVPPDHTLKTKVTAYVPMQHLSRLAALEVRHAFAAGRYDQALERAADGLAMGRRLTHATGHPFTTPMVGVLVTLTHLDTLHLERERWAKVPTPALTRFLQALNDLERVERPVEEMAIGERDALRRTLIKDRKSGMVQLADPAMAQRVSGLVANGYDAYMARLAARELEAGRQLTDRLKGRPGWLTDAAARLHPDEVAAQVLLKAHIGDMPDDFEFKVLPLETYVDATRIQLASELYRRAKGSAPATLEALVPAYLPAVPTDPFKPAQPLRMDAERIWSVGWDGTDEAGRQEAVWRRMASKGDYTQAGDVVFKR